MGAPPQHGGAELVLPLAVAVRRGAPGILGDAQHVVQAVPCVVDDVQLLLEDELVEELHVPLLGRRCHLGVEVRVHDLHMHAGVLEVVRHCGSGGLMAAAEGASEDQRLRLSRLGAFDVRAAGGDGRVRALRPAAGTPQLDGLRVEVPGAVKELGEGVDGPVVRPAGPVQVRPLAEVRMAEDLDGSPGQLLDHLQVLEGRAELERLPVDPPDLLELQGHEQPEGLRLGVHTVRLPALAQCEGLQDLQRPCDGGAGAGAHPHLPGARAR
mmetsp:Transcript_67968/g.196913  ORF Transcript_67968/g.196913 Transcript_67968/m.196913 type:complete len:268 (-) Transcript_67968:1053-1856(-)